VTTQPTLVTVAEFRMQESSAFPSEQAVRRAIREVPGFPYTRIGRKVYVDICRWQAFRENGGATLPGGWRKTPKDAARHTQPSGLGGRG
jgi:hypothetical protein